MSSSITFKTDTDGVTDPEGFFASADAADIRGKADERLDTGVLYSIAPCTAAGVFTRNAVKAAPVLDCERVLRVGGPIFGLVANSGNANACTGNQGIADSLSMVQAAELASGCPKDSFLVCSTGRIGDLLPMDKIIPAVKSVALRAFDGEKEGTKFSECILTSDTQKKTCTATFAVEGNTVTIGGAAKGAGMIQPNMATMLAFITTDIAADSTVLDNLLKESVKHSFNAITVDGDMSTNDTVLLLANGQSGVSLDGTSMKRFREALLQVCDCLADKIVADGERITKVVEILVGGAASDQDAENISRSIGNSLLVKTSWYGNDPNWGRLMDALGYANAQIDQHVIDISYDDVPALVGGNPVPENKPKWKEVVSKPRFTIRIEMHQGDGNFRLRASDLTEGYVNFNKSE
tara:strand:- start:92 stop:1312 length:1221 start_codon:yes stop_codon:yes gene_type:complete